MARQRLIKAIQKYLTYSVFIALCTTINNNVMKTTEMNVTLLHSKNTFTVSMKAFGLWKHLLDSECACLEFSISLESSFIFLARSVEVSCNPSYRPKYLKRFISTRVSQLKNKMR